jgi:Ca2+-binding RTX toxin-like protein
MAVLKWKSEFLVNTTTVGNQYMPSVTALSDGGFAIAWFDEGSVDDAIRWQRFDALGAKVGVEHVAAGIGNQYQPDLVQLADDNLWIVQRDADGSTFDIAGQVFNLDGVKIRTQDPSSNLAQALYGSVVASLGANGSVAAYTNGSVNGGDIQIKYFDAGGAAGVSFTVNTNSTTLGSLQNEVALAASPNGNRVVLAWRDHGLNSGDIRGRVLTENGLAFSGEFTFNTNVSNVQALPAVAWLDAYKFVAVWTGFLADGSSFGVQYKVFYENGAVVIDESQVNSTTLNAQSDADVTALPDGGFAVVWADSSGLDGDASFASVKLQVFNSNGSKRGVETLVNTTTQIYQVEPSIDTLADGRLIVTWRDDSSTGGDLSGSAVRAQIFDPREGVVNGDDSFNTLYGHDTQGDVIHGFGSSDSLFGLGGGDEIYGDLGSDVLSGGAGGDLLDGGDGNDTADYRSSSSGQVNINLLLDTASGGDAAGDLLDSIENLLGSLTLRDILIGDNQSNALAGFGGNDSLLGQDGDDFLIGGAGGDTLNGGAGAGDWASYSDSASGTVNVNLLLGAASGGEAQGDALFFIENLEGSSTLRDILIGNDVANSILGGGGNDSLRGEGGNDVISGNAGGDSLNAGAGVDTVLYISSPSGVTIDLNLGAQVSGGDGNGDALFFFENITGSGHDDTLRGNVLTNRLIGGAGADSLNGREGSDYLTGGGGIDTFRFDVANLGVDTIVDWDDGLDKISIGALVETSFAGLTFQDQGTTRVIIRGFNGSGAIAVESSSAFTLDAADFVFV